MISRSDVSGSEMRTSNHGSGRHELFHFIDDLPVAQQKTVRVLRELLVKIFRVDWFKTNIRFGIDRGLFLQKGFEELLWCRHAALMTEVQRPGPRGAWIATGARWPG